MAFGSKKREYDGKKGYLAVPEEMFDAPFSDIIACMDPAHLVDAVCLEFDNIFYGRRKFDDYRYLRLYPEWMNLLADELDTVLYHYVEKLEDCKKLIQYFPEFASHIYEFLVDEYIYQSEYSDSNFSNDIDIVNDVLIPASDLEKYQNYHFSAIRNRALEILDACDEYKEMWDIIWTFETYFDIPREYFQEYLVSCFSDFVDSYDEHYYAEKNIPAIYDSDDFNDVKDFIRDAEAYWYLMDRAPKLVLDNGLDFYTMLVKVVGPVKEILDLHSYCSEFTSDNFKEVLSKML